MFFGYNEVSQLGLRLTPSGITPGQDKLKAVETAKILEEIEYFLVCATF
jgi:hypothetical protein